MQANYVQRLRLTFRKFGPTRFIGHLDLARTLERSLTRARIPMAYTQGFNRHPRMQLATALPLGFTSECEMADIYLGEAMEPEAARTQMMARMAPGIEVVRVEEVPIKEPPLQTITHEAVYRVTLLDRVETAVLQQRIDDLMAAEEVVRERGHERKKKEYDLRPLILALAIEQVGEDETGTVLHMRLMLQHSRTGRPDEVLLELELDPLAARIHRTEIVLGEPIPSSQ